MISAGIVIVMMGLLFLLQRADTVSPPTAFTRNPAVLQPLPPIAGMGEVVAMTEDGDAAETYRKAIASYKRNESAYDKFADSTKTDEATVGRLREGFEAIKAGTNLTKCSLFVKDPTNVINYDSTIGDLPALKAVGLATVRMGLLLRDSNPKEAMALLEGAFSLGAKLFNERVSYAEAEAGISIMGSAVDQIIKLSEKSGNKDRATALREFEKARRAYYDEHMTPMYRVLSSLDPGVTNKHIGDVFVVAAQSQDRMWRVEAIRKLGIIRKMGYTRKRKGDELGAQRAVRKYAQDPDPVISTAGKVASELTTINGIR